MTAMRSNPHCSNCGDLRGGPFGHEISECQYKHGMTAGDVAAIQPEGRHTKFWDEQIDRYFEAHGAATFPKTGPDLLFEAGRYIAGRARKHHLGARRALLAVLIGETDEHSRECLEMAESWFKRQYGSAAALQSMQDESAAGALTACGCWYALELREAAEL